MDKLFYPALFHKAEEGGFWVTFPDLPECITEGDDMGQAYEMSVDALALCLESRLEENGGIPQPSAPDAIPIEEGAFLVIVEFDRLEYKKKHNKKSVKKTLTIPEWLNEEAVAKGINFSQTLQESLIAKCQL